MFFNRPGAILFYIAVFISANQSTAMAGPAAVDTLRAETAASEPHNWLLHGRTYDEQRFSPLKQINRNNIKQLGLAWHWEGHFNRGYEATPIVVDGVIYLTTSWSIVYALDARSGKQLWSYDPQVERGRNSYYACCDVVNRGVAVWQGRVYVGALDGRLIALDAATGHQEWQVQTLADDSYATITGAPRIVNNKVVIGNGGADFSARGYVSAYDTLSGKLQWRFFIVPGNPAKPTEGKHLKQARSSWKGSRYWQTGGGGTVWDAMAYDPSLNLLYVGTGNGSPWNREIRSPGGGDNLYLSSIVAINPDNGEMVWHYQSTPAEAWDYTATQPMILADLVINGKSQPVIMQAPKNGFFYVLNRRNGKFISAEPYVAVTWASHIDPVSGRPVENSERHYWDSPKVISPSPLGAHNWQPMSYSPVTGLVYIAARLDTSFAYSHPKNYKYDASKPVGNGMELFAALSPQETAKLNSGYGALIAWDPVAQREVWQVKHTQAWNGGTLSTGGGLVFQGLANGELLAYDERNGEILWRHQTQRGILASPITYAIDGEQYIALLAGWGGGPGRRGGVDSALIDNRAPGRLLVYKLAARQTLPILLEKLPQIVSMPKPNADAATVANGARIYRLHCVRCHSPQKGGALPDLRYIAPAVDKMFSDIVLGGIFAPRGMPGFKHLINEEQTEALQQYIRTLAHYNSGAQDNASDKSGSSLLKNRGDIH